MAPHGNILHGDTAPAEPFCWNRFLSQGEDSVYAMLRKPCNLPLRGRKTGGGELPLNDPAKVGGLVDKSRSNLSVNSTCPSQDNFSRRYRELISPSSPADSASSKKLSQNRKRNHCSTNHSQQRVRPRRILHSKGVIRYHRCR